jgi:hypothetical protein
MYGFEVHGNHLYQQVLLYKTALALSGMPYYHNRLPGFHVYSPVLKRTRTIVSIKITFDILEDKMLK